ncbi:phosphotransferase family protein [Lederbergia wuyishanensis]|uniref:Aminoglycoside phosphotransferase (APT) family kinase protein n=1 Tax=Lederbergia wuyishanensis TaxID=1347903 RepID=A0ABU0D9Q9_9BACI|nr:aminoglycoside phosphotransferase family protein [Lederbergia wuyishanensis]MCJ8008425.1 aminoglycoside phosphotransferase family protein [Lederbergia wuyishanensis]MDQ0345167.1 aminoglycoside phosphotransferase (APT) family kinase protein [Lederbergia wuyishanensis]
MVPIAEQEIPINLLNIIGKIDKMTFPEQGCTSNVGIVKGENGVFVLKRSKGARYAGWLEREAFILKSLSETNLPIPVIHAFEKNSALNESWILMNFIQGETMGEALQKEKDRAKKRNLIYQFGKVLKEIHSTTCPEKIYQPDTIWLDKIFDKAEIELQIYDLDGTPELLEQLRKEKPKNIKQTLIHGDFTVDNVLVHDGKIAAVIDWSGGAYGDPRLDVALAIQPEETFFTSEEDRMVFFEGYGETILNEKEYEYFANGVYEFL